MKHLSELLVGCGLLADGEEASELYVDEVFDGKGRFCYLDSTVSVSVLVEVEGGRVWNEDLLEEQHRRFRNGS